MSYKKEVHSIFKFLPCDRSYNIQFIPEYFKNRLIKLVSKMSELLFLFLCKFRKISPLIRYKIILSSPSPKYRGSFADFCLLRIPSFRLIFSNQIPSKIQHEQNRIQTEWLMQLAYGLPDSIVQGHKK